MKVLILGADGRLGKWVIDDLSPEAKGKDYDVVTMTRKLLHKFDVDNVIGTPMNFKDLENNIEGVNVILSCLGAKTVNEFKTMATNIAKVCVQNNIYLVWSGGAGTLKDKDGKRLCDLPKDKWTDKKLEVQVEGQAAALKIFQSTKGLKYTYLAPALLMDYARPEVPYDIQVSDKALYNKEGKSVIGYATQAAALIDLLNVNDKFIGKELTTVETGTSIPNLDRVKISK